MLKLIKIEFMKLRYGKSKNILITSLLIMLLLPILIAYGSVEGTVDYSFFSLVDEYYSINYYLLLPIALWVFTLSNVCNEFKNKAIKNTIMTKYSRSSIILAKFIVLAVSAILSYLLCVSIYYIWAYIKSGDSIVYINYKVASVGEIALNLILCNIETIFYMLAVISFSFMLGFTIKKQGISLLIYIFVITIVAVFLNSVQKYGGLYPKFIFTTLSNLEYLGISGFNYSRVVRMLPGLSNTFLFLAISDFSFRRYKY